MKHHLKRLLAKLKESKSLGIKAIVGLSAFGIAFITIASVSAATSDTVIDADSETTIVSETEITTDESRVETTTTTTTIATTTTTTTTTETTTTTVETEPPTTETEEETTTTVVEEITESEVVVYEDEVITYYTEGTIQPNHLNKYDGVSNAPNGFEETWYDLDMSGVIAEMRRNGFSESDYPYWVNDETGVKMFGPYVMVAADIDQMYYYSLGDLVETDLGTGIVCDTGSFRFSTPARYDIAVNWKHGYYPGFND